MIYIYIYTLYNTLYTYIYIYIYIYPTPRWTPSPKDVSSCHWLPDGVRTSVCFFTQVPQIPIQFPIFGSSAHILPQMPYMLSHLSVKVD